MHSNFVVHQVMESKQDERHLKMLKAARNHPRFFF